MRLFEGEIRMTTAPCISLPIAVNSALTTFVPGAVGYQNVESSKISAHDSNLCPIRNCTFCEAASKQYWRKNNLCNKYILRYTYIQKFVARSYARMSRHTLLQFFLVEFESTWEDLDDTSGALHKLQAREAIVTETEEHTPVTWQKQFSLYVTSLSLSRHVVTTWKRQ